MLSVLFLILKIIGIALLAILALVLLILLLVLLVPFRYGIKADGKAPDIKAKARLSWLARIISASAGYDGKFYWRVKALCFTILPEKEKPEDDSEQADEPSEENLKANEPAPAGEPEMNNPPDTEQKKEENPVEKPPKEEAFEKEAFEKEAKPEEGAVGAPETGAPAEETLEEPSEETADESAEEPSDESSDGTAEEASEEKISFKEKISRKIDEITEKLRAKYEELSAKYEELSAKADKAVSFIEDEKNRRAFEYVKKSIFKMLKHFRPRTLKGSLNIGLEDPSVTGRILAVYYGALIGLYPEFRLTGEFEEQVIEGRFRLKGHIRLIHVVSLGVKLILNKQIRYWIKLIRRKE